MFFLALLFSFVLRHLRVSQVFTPRMSRTSMRYKKQTCELSQITMLTSTKAEEIVNKYEVVTIWMFLCCHANDVIS